MLESESDRLQDNGCRVYPWESKSFAAGSETKPFRRDEVAEMQGSTVMPPYSSKAVANEFLKLAGLGALTPMKLLKLVYFAHGWHLAIAGGTLIDEQIEAWPYGPVVTSLYHDLKKYGSSPISAFIEDLEFEDDDRLPRITTPFVVSDDSEPDEGDVFAKALIDRVWELYGRLTAGQLSNMTHEAGSPWDAVKTLYGDRPIPKGTDIPEDAIRDYFKSKLLTPAAS
ncbi:MAG: Panacea domain-containing protein [Planctomycetia bacterium]